jgi:GTP cyclohydrolase IB
MLKNPNRRFGGFCLGRSAERQVANQRIDIVWLSLCQFNVTTLLQKDSMNAPEKLPLPDIQATVDTRAIPIARVGIKSVRFPFTVRSVSGETMATVASVDMYVGLPAEQKGTHMSRFIEILETHGHDVSTEGFANMFDAMLKRLEAQTGYIEMRFPFFIMKTAPVSGVQSLMDYDVVIRREKKAPDAQTEYRVQVTVPVTSLCPCSKEISAYGAHNQRSHVTINALIASPVPMSDFVRIAERAASCELYGLLKRPDEKYVTERAYDNPKFVEDLVRDIALELKQDDRVAAFTVASENFESIHNHSAYAELAFDKRV